MSKEREQKLIDMMFEMSIGHEYYLTGRSREQIAEWLAKQLEHCGFKTEPRGMSWAVLID